MHIVSGMNGWQDHWLVGAAELGLEIMPGLADGRYAGEFPSKLIDPLVAELRRLRPWMEARDYDLYVGFIDRIIRVFDETDPDEFEYSFG
ncbi:MAG: hypothetical protein ABGY75_19165 [Gemmataceae bacterium]